MLIGEYQVMIDKPQHNNLDTNVFVDNILNELQALKDKYLQDNTNYDEWEEGKGQGISEAIEIIYKYKQLL